MKNVKAPPGAETFDGSTGIICYYSTKSQLISVLTVSK